MREKNVPTIYSEAIKVLYETVDASKLSFDDLTSFLANNLGTIVNPYDTCVVNKVIDGKPIHNIMTYRWP